MKKFLMFIPLVFLLCFAFSCQQGEEGITEEDVKILLDNFVKFSAYAVNHRALLFYLLANLLYINRHIIISCVILLLIFLL